MVALGFCWRLAVSNSPEGYYDTGASYLSPTASFHFHGGQVTLEWEGPISNWGHYWRTNDSEWVWEVQGDMYRLNVSWRGLTAVEITNAQETAFLERKWLRDLRDRASRCVPSIPAF